TDPNDGVFTFQIAGRARAGRAAAELFHRAPPGGVERSPAAAGSYWATTGRPEGLRRRGSCPRRRRRSGPWSNGARAERKTLLSRLTPWGSLRLERLYFRRARVRHLQRSGT